MNSYLVFGSTKRPVFGGGHFLDWSEPPIGVYQADDPDEACKAAASDNGTMGTFVAVVCHVWGVEVMPSTARKLGQKATAEERLAAHLDRLAELNEQARQIATQTETHDQ